MTDEALALSADEVNSKPSEIGESIAQLALAIQDSKTDLEEIQNRSFFKKLINNNTRDLAQAMLKQNDTISAFLTIIQGVILLSMNNLVVLGSIMDSINKQEATNDFRDNKYIGMAKSYLSEAIKSAQRAEMNENEIKTLRKELVDFYKTHADHDRLIAELREELFQRRFLDDIKKSIEQAHTDQSKRIDSLSEEQIKMKSQIFVCKLVLIGFSIISAASLLLYFIK